LPDVPPPAILIQDGMGIDYAVEPHLALTHPSQFEYLRHQGSADMTGSSLIGSLPPNF
jgi:hypothetical protein